MKPPRSPADADESAKTAPKPAATLFPVSGPIGVSDVQASAESRAQAKLLLDTVFGDDRGRFRPEEPTPKEQDSNIALPGEGKRIKLDDLLGAALASLGYKRIAKLVYRADWSTPDVEHILYFDTYGVPKIYLTGEAGLRNDETESFANQCERRYARPIIRDSEHQYPSWWCAAHFSLGMAAGWKSRWSLNTLDYSQGALAETVVQAVRDFVLPTVGGVTTIATMFDLLVRDEEPLRWSRTGPYFRAAQLAFLGRKLGMTVETIEAALQPYRRGMTNGIDTSVLTPDEYIAHIIRDADAALAASSSRSDGASS